MASPVTPCCRTRDYSDLECDECHGSGDSPDLDDDGDYQDCEECDGDGYQVGECECDECGEPFYEHELIYED